MTNIAHLYQTIAILAEELATLHRQLAEPPSEQRPLWPPAELPTPAPVFVPTPPTYEERRTKFLADLSLAGGKLPPNFFSLVGDERGYTREEAERWLGLTPGTLG